MVGVGIGLALDAPTDGVAVGLVSISAGAGAPWLQEAAASATEVRAATSKERDPGMQKWYTISVSNQG